MLTLTPLSLFRCLSYAAHRCHGPGINPLFLFCPFYFSTENKTALTLPAITFGTLMFEAEYIKDEIPSALIIMVLPNSVKSRDLHMSNFACMVGMTCRSLMIAWLRDRMSTQILISFGFDGLGTTTIGETQLASGPQRVQ